MTYHKRQLCEAAVIKLVITTLSAETLNETKYYICPLSMPCCFHCCLLRRCTRRRRRGLRSMRNLARNFPHIFCAVRRLPLCDLTSHLLAGLLESCLAHVLRLGQREAPRRSCMSLLAAILPDRWPRAVERHPAVVGPAAPAVCVPELASTHVAKPAQR